MYLIVSLRFFNLGFWSGNFFLTAPFPGHCLLVPSNILCIHYNGLNQYFPKSVLFKIGVTSIPFYRKAGCQTDKAYVWCRLVVRKLNLRIQPARRPQGKKAPKRLDVSKLIQDSMRQAFLTDICSQLGAINLSSEKFNPEENWTVFHKTAHSSAATTLGHPSRKHQDWFDENDDEIQKLLEEKHRLHKAQQDDTSSVSRKAAYSNIYKTVQTKLRDMQDS